MFIDLQKHNIEFTCRSAQSQVLSVLRTTLTLRFATQADKCNDLL